MTRAEVMIWAQRIAAMKHAEPHVLLEITQDATVDVAQNAFHAIARVAHPDLHRTTATREELELVTTAFGLVAAAFHTFRRQAMKTTKMPMMTMPQRGAAPVETSEVGPTPTGMPSMSPKALVAYRKAEQSLRRGDLKTALLHLKMAIAADGQSAFLRQALKEVESELGKKP